MEMLKEAIKLASEKGGYENYKLVGSTCVQNNPNIDGYAANLLDPAFWKAVGRALAWDEIEGHISKRFSIVGTQPEWLVMWMVFIDWIAEEKNPDDYFKQLIK